jgi:hypothetical protein
MEHIKFMYAMLETACAIAPFRSKSLNLAGELSRILAAHDWSTRVWEAWSANTINKTIN